MSTPVDVTEAKAALKHARGRLKFPAPDFEEREAFRIVETALADLVEQVEAQTAENVKLREALFQVFVNLGEDTDGITSGAEFDAHVNPKLADMVPRLVAEYRAEMEREAEDADAEIQRLRAGQPTEQWEYEYRPVHVSGEEWAGRSEEAAAATLKAYPEEWTFVGEEKGGPNGCTHANAYRRRPAGPWVLVDQEEQK